jgi:diguanylate cyclase (GGDEF)-like protein/PAS domain S-box-containing protein
MKYIGRFSAFILVSIMFFAYYFSKSGNVNKIELIGYPLLLVLAWWGGKQYDKVKFLVEQNQIQIRELERSTNLFQSIYEKAPIGIALLNPNGSPVISNLKLQEMLGYSEKELSQMTFSDFSDSVDAEANMALLKDLIAGKIDSYQLEKRYYRKNGELIWGDVTSALFPSIDHQSFFVIGMVTDITERKMAEQKLQKTYQEMEYLSNRDGLTNIANRRYFDKYLLIEWQRAKRHAKPLSLIILDIDCYKTFNDTYGHLAGDECLKQIAKALEKTVNRSTDVAARFGGEEFAVILPETDLIGATVVANNIKTAISALKIPHTGSNVNNFVTISIGVSTILPDLHAKPEDLINKTDQALYQAKEKGRNRVEIVNQTSLNLV